MAQRRMLRSDMITSAWFMSLTDVAQLSYVRLCHVADDEGFIHNPKMVVRSKVTLSTLEKAGLIFTFPSGIVLIRHWFVHNRLRKDTAHQTIHAAEKALVTLDFENIYQLKSDTDAVQNRNESAPQESIGKDSSVKESAGTAAMVAASGGAPTETDMEKNFLLFWEAYPKKMDEAATRQVFMETREDFAVIMEGLEHHKNCNQWVSDNGCFIPDPKNWLKRQGWKYRPPLYKQKAVPSPPVLYGGTGQLGPEELAAIQRTLAEG